jgi:hypothetical protein
VEFFHLTAFLLSYCSNRWPGSQAAGQPLQAGQQADCGSGSDTGGTGNGTGTGRAGQRRRAMVEQHAGLEPVHRLSVEAPAFVPGAGGHGGGTSSGASAGSHLSSAGGSPAVPGPRQRPPPPGQANSSPPLAQLLQELLLLLGHFAVLNPSNQAILQWGKAPCITQRLAQLPPECLQQPELRRALLPTLLCVCYCAERAADVVQRCLGLGPLLEYLDCSGAEAQQQQGQEGVQQGPLALQRRFPPPLLPRAVEWLRQRCTLHAAQHAAQAAPDDAPQQPHMQQ